MADFVEYYTQFLHFKNKGHRPSFASTYIFIEKHTTKNDAKVEF